MNIDYISTFMFAGVILANILNILFVYGLYRFMIGSMRTLGPKIAYWIVIGLPTLYVGFAFSILIVPDFVFVQCRYWDWCWSNFGW